MSAYPSEPWQEGGNGFCNDGQFVRSGDGVFFPQQQQQDLAYLSNSALQNGTGQFGVGRCGEERWEGLSLREKESSLHALARGKGGGMEWVKRWC